jgi:hypothetical protein
VFEWTLVWKVLLRTFDINYLRAFWLIIVFITLKNGRVGLWNWIKHIHVLVEHSWLMNVFMVLLILLLLVVYQQLMRLWTLSTLCCILIRSTLLSLLNEIFIRYWWFSIAIILLFLVISLILIRPNLLLLHHLVSLLRMWCLLLVCFCTIEKLLSHRYNLRLYFSCGQARFSILCFRSCWSKLDRCIW